MLAALRRLSDNCSGFKGRSRGGMRIDYSDCSDLAFWSYVVLGEHLKTGHESRPGRVGFTASLVACP